MTIAETLMWVAIVQALATIFLGGIAAWIAVQQVKLKRSAHRLELYERRYAVYDDAHRFLRALEFRADLSMDDYFKYTGAFNRAKFVFDDEIVAFLSDIKRRAPGIRDFPIKPVDKVDAISSYEPLKSDDAKWLREQFSQMDKLFSPYLKFGMRPT